LEVDQLIEEINNIAATTSYNGQKLLDGSGATNAIQSGLNAGEVVSFTVGGVSSTKLGLSGGLGGNVKTGRIDTTFDTTATDAVYINGVDMGDSTNLTTATDIATWINTKTGLTGVTADAYNRLEGSSVGLGELEIGSFTVGGVTFASSSSLNDLASKINEQTAVMAEVTSDGRLILSNTTGANIVTAGAGVSQAGLEGAGTFTGFLQLSNSDGSADQIDFTLGDSGTEAMLNDLGLMKNATNGAVTGATVHATAGATTTTNAITINGVSIGAVGDTTASAAQYIAAINAVTEQTKVSATARTVYNLTLLAGGAGETLDTSTAASTDVDDFAINGTFVAFSLDDEASDIVAAINSAVGSLGITASAKTDGTIDIVSETGQDIVLSGTEFNNDTEVTTKGQITLQHADGGAISIGSLATTEALKKTAVEAAGLTLSNSYSSAGGGLNISTAASALSALDTLDTAILGLSNNRAEMGAYLKRFEAETSNLMVAIEKTSEALSAIVDADFAQESANLAKAQVLQQAGTAMLAQANASTQNVLALLK
jgi:flagellin